MTTVRDALVAWFLHEWWDDVDVPAAELDADHVLTLLHALPVEQRMEAMGMVEVELGGEADPWYVESFAQCDASTYWVEEPRDVGAL